MSPLQQLQNIQEQLNNNPENLEQRRAFLELTSKPKSDWGEEVINNIFTQFSQFDHLRAHLTALAGRIHHCQRTETLYQFLYKHFNIDPCLATEILLSSDNIERHPSVIEKAKELLPHLPACLFTAYFKTWVSSPIETLNDLAHHSITKLQVSQIGPAIYSLNNQENSNPLLELLAARVEQIVKTEKKNLIPALSILLKTNPEQGEKHLANYLGSLDEPDCSEEEKLRFVQCALDPQAPQRLYDEGAKAVCRWIEENNSPSFSQKLAPHLIAIYEGNPEDEQAEQLLVKPALKDLLIPFMIKSRNKALKDNGLYLLKQNFQNPERSLSSRIEDLVLWVEHLSPKSMQNMDTLLNINTEEALLDDLDAVSVTPPKELVVILGNLYDLASVREKQRILEAVQNYSPDSLLELTLSVKLLHSIHNTGLDEEALEILLAHASALLVEEGFLQSEALTTLEAITEHSTYPLSIRTQATLCLLKNETTRLIGFEALDTLAQEGALPLESLPYLEEQLQKPHYETNKKAEDLLKLASQIKNKVGLEASKKLYHYYRQQCDDLEARNCWLRFFQDDLEHITQAIDYLEEQDDEGGLLELYTTLCNKRFEGLEAMSLELQLGFTQQFYNKIFKDPIKQKRAQQEALKVFEKIYTQLSPETLLELKNLFEKGSDAAKRLSKRINDFMFIKV